MVSSIVSTQYTHVTDRQTDKRWCGFVVCLCRERRNEIPVNHVGFLSFFFYSWLDPIMWRMFRDPNYDPIDRCRCPDLEKASINADRYKYIRISSSSLYYETFIYCESKNCTLLRASAMLKHVIDIGWTSVRPSVCLSVCLSVCHTLVLYQNSWTYCHNFFNVR